MNTDTLVDPDIDAHESSEAQTADGPDSDNITADVSLASPRAQEHITHVSPAELRPHQLNSSLYGEMVDKGLLASIRERGILEPLVVTAELVLVGGHRRWAAAKQLGIPIRIVATTSPEAVELLLLESNLQRHKTNEVKLREYRHYLRLEKTLAKGRQGRKADRGANMVANSPQCFVGGKARDLAAARIGMKASTAEKGLKVLEAIEAQSQQPDRRSIDELRKLLNEQSFSAAFNRVVELGWIKTSGHNTNPTMQPAEAASDTSGGEHAPSSAILPPQDVSGSFSSQDAGPAALDVESNDPDGVERLGCAVLTERDSSLPAASPAATPASEKDDGVSAPGLLSSSTVEKRIATIRKENATTATVWTMSDIDQALIERFTQLLCAAVNTAFADRPKDRLLECARKALSWVSTELGVGGV